MEEETRKQETSKWLECHFGSESRSSNNSIDNLDLDEREFHQTPPLKTNNLLFNVTIKSNPPRNNHVTNGINKHDNGFGGRVYSSAEPVRERIISTHHQGDGYFQGLTDSLTGFPNVF